MSSNRKQTNVTNGDGEIRPTVKSTASKGILGMGIRPGYLLALLIVGLVFILTIPTVFAEGNPYYPLNNQNGTSGYVNGSLYVKAYQPIPFGSQGSGSSRDLSQTFELPSNIEIKWARLYVMVYSGSGVNNWPVNLTVVFNGGSGDTTLTDKRILQTQSGMDGHCYWLDDQTTKVYSDYLLWYDVMPYMIAGNDPIVYIHDQQVPGYDFDGRIKAVQLIVAYNNTSGSSSTTYYWVKQGQEWFFTEDEYPYLEYDSVDFDTTSISGRTDVTSAVITEMSTSSKDAFYYFTGNGTECALNPNYRPGSPYNYFNNNTWSVYNYLNQSGSGIANPCKFRYHHSDQTGEYGAGSYQIQTATLAIKF